MVGTQKMIPIYLGFAINTGRMAGENAGKYISGKQSFSDES